MNIYIDIDGVILASRTDYPAAFLVPGAREFLAAALEVGPCFWLSTHTRDGDHGAALRYLAPYADPAFLRLARRVRATRWDVLKTDALPREFLWFDDAPLAGEVRELERRGQLDRLVRVDVRREPASLAAALEQLRRATTEDASGP